MNLLNRFGRWLNRSRRCFLCGATDNLMLAAQPKFNECDPYEGIEFKWECQSHGWPKSTVRLPHADVDTAYSTTQATNCHINPHKHTADPTGTIQCEPAHGMGWIAHGLEPGMEYTVEWRVG